MDKKIEPTLTEQQLLRQKAQELINALDQYQGVIPSSQPVQQKDKRFVTNKAQNLQLIRNMIAASWKKKYPYN